MARPATLKHAGQIHTYLPPNATLPDIFEDEQIQPEQFFPKPAVAMTGCRALMWAVLLDAVNTWLKHCSGTKRRDIRITAEEEGWFTSPAMVPPFSFLNICNELDLDPGYIIRGLFLMKQRIKKDPHAAADARRELGSTQPRVGPSTAVRVRAERRAPQAVAA